MDNNADVTAHCRANIAAQEQLIADARALLEHREADLAVLHEALRVVKEQEEALGLNGLHLADAPTAGHTANTAAPETPMNDAPAPKRRNSRAVTPDIDLTGVRVDFTGTENIVQRIIRIAETVPGMKLNVTQVVKLLIEHNQTQQSVHNARVSVGRDFESHPDLFERIEVGRATYRYLGGENHQQKTIEPFPAHAVTVSPNGRSEHDHE